MFRRLDPDAAIERLGPEGEWREAPAPVLRVTGAAGALLTAERTALNFLGRLSGVATLTATVVRGDRGGRRHRAAARHAQDDAGPAGAGEARGRRRRRRQPPRRALRLRPDQGEPRRARRRCGRGGAARAGRAPGPAARGRGARPRRDRRGARRRRAAAAAGQHDARAGRRRGRAGGRPRGARGVGRRDARHSCCLLDHKWARLRLDGRPDPLRARPRPVPPPRDLQP